MRDFKAPFEHNQAVRELRMWQVRQQISGGFRTAKGGEEFCRLSSYLSTMKKQGHRIMEAIKSVFAGETIPPVLRG
jgi:transposase